LSRRHLGFLRLDGDLLSPVERQNRISLFNNPMNREKYFAFLLTTQAGGVGINLTGADRVIIGM
jgi:SNF2 family DNA or RNA helicase